MKQKILILGGGVIGLYLALKLAKKGHKVYIYEKKSRETFFKKSCSTLVSSRIKSFVDITGCVENEIKGCKIIFDKKTVELNFSPFHLAINKERLMKKLLRKAEECGVKVYFEKTIEEFEKSFDKIIGCDGANSFVRKKLKLRDPQSRLGLQVFTEEKDDSNFVKTWAQKTGFIWHIPRGDYSEYGILDKFDNILRFDKFLKDNNISFYKKSSAVVPSSLIIPENKNITLCGDASGLTKPWSGGGIIWGLTQADILAENSDDFLLYKKEAEKFFKGKLAKGRIYNNLVYFLGNYFPYILPSKIIYDNDFPCFFKTLKSILKVDFRPKK